jgi:branched-chain amino acid transport system substrate-binding protein
MVSPGSTNPSVTEKGDCIFRVCFIDPFQGTVMAKFALDNLHEKGSPFCRM